MGNKSYEQVNFTESEFKDTCHPGLHCCKFSETGNLLLSVQLNIGIKAWWNTIQPLIENSSSSLIKKHNSYQEKMVQAQNPDSIHQLSQQKVKRLFIPTSIQQVNPYGKMGGCFNMSLTESYYQGKKELHIYYENYIYTLENQINSRKSNQLHFHQWQIWKLLKNCSLALYQWYKLFPRAMFGEISSKNIVMNNRGKIKLVNHISFPTNFNRVSEQNQKSSNGKASSRLHNNDLFDPRVYNPNDYNPHLVLKAEPYQGFCLQAVGWTILQVMTLQVQPFSAMPKKKKLQLMMDNSKYSFDLRTFVADMLTPNFNARPRLQDVIDFSKEKQKEIKKGLAK